MRKKKSLITKCSAAVMSLLMVAGSIGNYSIVYAANTLKQETALRSNTHITIRFPRKKQ